MVAQKEPRPDERPERVDDGREQGLHHLQQESERIVDWVAELSEPDWRAPTPATGWTVADQIAHLTWTDEIAVWSIDSDPRWSDLAVTGPAVVDAAAHALADQPRTVLMERWATARSALAERLRTAVAKINWFGPPMSPRSMISARIMETWAHGTDIADTLGHPVGQGPALRDIAHLGVRTRDFAYRLNRLDPPTTQFAVGLRGPAGEAWEWGPAETADRVSGSAVDFCLLVTRRRHRDDLDLTATGEAARWLEIAQAFAGPPGAGRPPVGR